MKLELYINNTRVDMFDDETVQIKKSVKDAKNPDKLFTDLSRTISIPASKTNNKLFVHAYRSDTNAVDVRAYLDAEIKINGVTYSEGFVNLEKVQLKSRVAHSYSVRYTGRLLELKKTFKEDKLGVIDLSSLDFLSSLNGFKSKLEASSGDLRMGLCSVKERLVAHSTDFDYGAELEEKTAQIMYNSANASTHAQSHGVQFDSIRPSIKVERLISEIESYYGITFTGALKEDYIDNLYCLLHRQGVESGASLLEESLFTFTSQSDTDSPYSISSTGTLLQSASDVSEDTINVTVTGTGLSKVQILNSSGSVIHTATGTSPLTVNKTVTTFGSSNYYKLKVFGESGNTFSASGTFSSLIDDTTTGDGGLGGFEGLGNSYSMSISVSGSASTEETFVVNEHLPDIKVIDFIGGLFKMFNIVATVDGTTIDTQTYEDFISAGTHYGDITQYIDSDSQTVSPANKYSSVKLEFAEPKTRLEKAFKDFNLREYGSNEYAGTDIDSKRISGDTYKVSLPFQMPVGEPLYDKGNPSSTPVLSYVHIADESGEEVSIKPFLHYFKGTQEAQDIRLRADGFDADGGYSTSQSSSINVTSHNVITPYGNYDVFLSFGGNEIDYADISEDSEADNLFTNFYQTSIVDAFNSSARRLECTAYLPQRFHLQFELNSTVTAYGITYRVESVETNFLTGRSDLTLVTA